MNEFEIRNLREVLNRSIRRQQKITEIKIENLTAPGENYGSVMLKLDVVLKDEENGQQEEIHLVAKQLPDNEIAKRVFNNQITFKNEIAMYISIIPTLQNFQRENGVNEVIDCFSRFYGGRINLSGENGIVDEDAVIILENLILKGNLSIKVIANIGYKNMTVKSALKKFLFFFQKVLRYINIFTAVFFIIEIFHAVVLVHNYLRNMLIKIIYIVNGLIMISCMFLCKHYNSLYYIKNKFS